MNSEKLSAPEGAIRKITSESIEKMGLVFYRGEQGEYTAVDSEGNIYFIPPNQGPGGSNPELQPNHFSVGTISVISETLQSDSHFVYEVLFQPKENYIYKAHSDIERGQHLDISGGFSKVPGTSKFVASPEGTDCLFQFQDEYIKSPTFSGVVEILDIEKTPLNQREIIYTVRPILEKLNSNIARTEDSIEHPDPKTMGITQ